MNFVQPTDVMWSEKNIKHVIQETKKNVTRISLQTKQALYSHFANSLRNTLNCWKGG